jgi:hypothetical protein
MLRVSQTDDTTTIGDFPDIRHPPDPPIAAHIGGVTTSLQPPILPDMSGCSGTLLTQSPPHMEFLHIALNRPVLLVVSPPQSGVMYRGKANT